MKSQFGAASGNDSACTDIEYLRVQAGQFSHGRSDSTLSRTFRRIDETTLAGLWEAMAEVHSRVWSRCAVTTGTAEVILDIDASLVLAASRSLGARWWSFQSNVVGNRWIDGRNVL